MQFKNIFIFLVFLLSLPLFKVDIVFALSSSDFSTIPIVLNSSLPDCKVPTQCNDVGDECNNGPNNQDSGGCGTACSQGDPWSKYVVKCKVTSYSTDPVTGERIETCGERLVYQDKVCSTADKCTSTTNNPYLNAGSCSCTGGPNGDGVQGIYKTCCSNTTPSYVINDPNSGTSNSCVQIAVDNTNPPYEGVCPAGSSSVRCGPGYGVACGQSACGPLATPPPPPSCESINCIYSDNSSGVSRCYSGHSDDPNCSSSDLTKCFNNTVCTYQQACTGTQSSEVSCPSSPAPACNVSFSFSSSTPSPNSNVLVTVTGTSNFGWNGASYNLDNLNWINTSSPPTSFNVNSGSAGFHSLQFSAVSNGNRIICGSNEATFYTQGPQNNAATCSQYVINNGNPVTAGTIVPVSITMTNSGDTTWVNSGPTPYKLGAQQPQDSSSWGTATGSDSNLGYRPIRDNLDNSVSSNQTASFNFNVTAPNTAGTYRLSFQMVEEAVEWFGALCQPNIDVQSSPWTVTCSGTVTPAGSKTVAWTATPSPSGTYTYSWSGDELLSGTSSSITKTYSDYGVKNAQVTATDSSGSQRSYNCSVSVPPPNLPSCTMTADTYSGNAPVQTDIHISFQDPNALANMPGSKVSKWDLDGNNSFEKTDNALDETVTYTQTTQPHFKVVDGVTGQDLSQVCSTTITVGSSSPPGSACNGPTESCYDTRNGLSTGCQPTSSDKNLWCQGQLGGIYACQDCPAATPPPNSQTCPTQPRTPPNDAPTVTLQPDGHTVVIEYPTGRDFTGNIYRSTSKGFINSTSSQNISTQFGNTSPTFDTSLGENQVYYYQSTIDNGAQQDLSNTYAAVSTSNTGATCSQYGGGSEPIITSAQYQSSTATSITFSLYYRVPIPNPSPSCTATGCSNPPPPQPPQYLMIQRASQTTPAYIPWNTGSPLYRCSAGASYSAFNGNCYSSDWVAGYTIDLPPNTSDTFYIGGGFNTNYCSNIYYVDGGAGFSGSTTTGSSSTLTIPTISVSNGSNPVGQQYSSIGFSPQKEGQVLKFYKVNGTNNDTIRWSGTALSTAKVLNQDQTTWILRATDDLKNQPEGYYYYGARLDLFSLTGNCNRDRYATTDQAAYYWRPPLPAWIKTTGGDVYSHSIDTPGGP